MIQEYALDPTVLATEFISQYGFLRGAFSDTGRVLSQYPRKWKRKVLRKLGDIPERDRMKLEELLKRWLLPHSIIRELSPYDGADWLAEAENEDARLPFHGILAEENPRKHDRVIPFDSIVTGDHPLWDCTKSCRARRTSKEIAEAITPLLVRAKRIVLIDPYFCLEPRYLDVLLDIVAVLSSETCVHPLKEVHVFTALKGTAGKTPDAQVRANVAHAFEHDCSAHLPAQLPQGFVINFSVYFEKDNSADAHDRHILTDIAGVDFGKGLDRRMDLQDEGPVRLNLLDYAECCRLEEDFQPYESGNSASYLIEAEFSING